jgi:hypothetical protein
VSGCNAHCDALADCTHVFTADFGGCYVKSDLGNGPNGGNYVAEDLTLCIKLTKGEHFAGRICQHCCCNGRLAGWQSP